MTQRAVLLEALASTPGDITRIARSLPDAAAGITPPTLPSPLQLIAHMVAAEQVYMAWINRVLAEDQPALPDELPVPQMDVTIGTLAEGAERFQATRTATIERLKGIKPGEWQRAGHRAIGGRITVRGLVDELVARDIEHSSRLVELVQEWRKATAADSGDRS